VTFAAFYPEYLQAHIDPRTRLIHTVGLLSGLAVGLTGIATRKPKRILTGLALGYLPAFVSHWVFEKNQPKTFRQPVLSFAADFAMVYQVLTGTLEVPDQKPS
jgi:hypothetical protein